MQVSKSGTQVRVVASKYTVTFDRQLMLARLDVPGSNLYYHMSMLSAIDRMGRADETIRIERIRTRKEHGSVLVEIRQKSRLWGEKTAYYRCYDEVLEHYVVVKGNGAIDRAYFCRGRVGPNELGSIPGFDYLFSGCPNFLEKDYFHASDYTSINAGLESYAWGPALASGPLCFAMTRDFKPPWLSVGVAARPGEYTFQSFEFNHKPEPVRKTHDSIVGTQSFSLAYFGHLKVDGLWETPHLVFNVAGNKYAAIKKYVSWLYRNEYLHLPRRRRYDWWSGPIFCGWHEQVARACIEHEGKDLSRQALETGPAAVNICTQKGYESWLAHLRKHDIHPGIVIIDALWQVAWDTNEVDTNKWPDLRGFVDQCHRRNQKVMLWISSWCQRDNVPDEQCILLDGKPVAVDPTHPKSIRRLKHEVRTMLSDDAGCYNADGFKVDYTTLQQFGYTMKTYADIYGFELQKFYMKMIYDQAKSVKKDALIGVFIANPYFRDVCDMVRTGDMYTVKGDPLDAMRTRVRLIKIGMPGAMVDTDGEFAFCMTPRYIDLIDEQARVGIPTIYNAERLMRHRTFALPILQRFSAEAYGRISKAFQAYSAGRSRKGRSK